MKCFHTVHVLLGVIYKVAYNTFSIYASSFVCAIIDNPYHYFFICNMQEIKRDNEIKGTASCKIALYTTFLRCGVRTWEQVLMALHNSDQGEIAKEVQMQLLEFYSKVINMCIYIFWIVCWLHNKKFNLWVTMVINTSSTLYWEIFEVK